MLSSAEQKNIKFLIKQFSDMLLEKTSKKEINKVSLLNMRTNLQDF